jgi:hypothetical protein
MKFVVVNLSLWKWEGLVVVGGTTEDFVALAKRQGATRIDDTAVSSGRAYVELGVPWMLWVETLEDVPAIAHEAFHVTCSVLECRGLKHTIESEEAYTYTMEAIIRAVLSAAPEQWEAVAPAD